MASTRSTQTLLSEFDRATVWLGSEPLTGEALRGRTVAVDFCTYSCVNWLRTLPYVRGWAERYADQGLAVVGVHSPEFGFEHDLGNVRRATRALGVTYPVVLDNEFAIWQAFGNRYWPALYLLDGDGQLRFHHFGEGAYEVTERAIQRLLGLDERLSPVDAGGLALAADWDALASPETYVGGSRGDPRRQAGGAPLALNDWALSGDWTATDDAVELERGPGSIAYRFRARDLNLVMAPPPAGGASRFSVRLDGEPPGDAHGLDVGPDGEGLVAEPRMYQLIRGPVRAGERTFEITVHDAGVRAYVFTFG